MNAYEKGKAGSYHLWVQAEGGTGLAYRLDGAKLGRTAGKSPLGRNGMTTPATVVLPANTMYLVLSK